VYWVTSSSVVSMYIHLFQCDHILVCVMNTPSTLASSIFRTMASIESNEGRPPIARSMRQISSPFLASFHLAMNSGVAT
jgi:hypothetical protein